MFSADDIVKVLIPNAHGAGFDYRAAMPVDVGDFVSVSVMNKNHDGIVLGKGDGNIPAEKIKPILARHGFSLPKTTVEWMRKMSEWTMMPPGAVLKLMMSAANFAIRDSRFGIRRAASGVADTGEIFTNREIRDTGAIKLNDEQRRAADAIEIDGFSATLIDGITGSGKTQVYFDAVGRVLSAGKSVLIMMPEIALTAQFISRFRERFGVAPSVWHSNLTPARRRKVWHGVLVRDIKIVVGTRSALFLPWQDLGLVVVDEEHDSSYKQEEMGNYHARDMAVLLGKISGFPVILASATPSFETIRNVMVGKYKIQKLTSRFGGAKLPKVEIVDMRKR